MAPSAAPRRGPLLAGILGSFLLLLLVVGGLLLWRFGDQLLAVLGLKQQVATAAIMPANSNAYAALSLNLQNREGLDALKRRYLDQPMVREWLDEAQSDLMDDDLDIERDIAPWIGTEIGVAIYDLETTMTEGEDPRFLVAISTRDEGAARAFIEREIAGSALSYSGVDYWIEDRRDAPAVALSDGFVLLAPDEAALHAAIDRQQGKQDGLATAPLFQTLTARLPTDSVLTLYGDTSVLNSFNEAMLEEMGAQNIAQPDQQMAAGVTLHADGIEVEFVTHTDLDSLPPALREGYLSEGAPPTLAALDRLPADTLGAMVLEVNPDLWRAGMDYSLGQMEEMSPDPMTEMIFGMFEGIFGTMNGEMAMAFLAADTGNDPFATPVEFYFLLGSDDVRRTETALEDMFNEIDPYMLEAFEPGAVDDRPLKMIDEGSFRVGYGAWDNYFLFGMGARVFERAFAAPDASLRTAPRFVAVQERLPAESSVVVYFDIQGAVETFEAMGMNEDEEYRTEVKPLLDPIVALGVAGTSQLDAEGYTEARMFLMMEE